LATFNKVKIDNFGVGLVQALQACSGDVKSIDISNFDILFFKVGTDKIEIEAYGHWGIEQ
jgi:hypothetical protein